MEIFVLSRAKFDNIMHASGINDSTVEIVDDAFFISVLSTKEVPGGNFHLPFFEEKHDNVLTVTFDDIINDQGHAVYLDKNNEAFIQKGKAIYEEQAEEIVNFILKHKDKNLAMIHCAAGISRSGAIGAFINDLVGNKYSEFKKTNPQVHENNRVSKLLKKKYEESKNNN